PGEETSYGNAGLIQREAVIPYTFPREFGVVLSSAMNNRRYAVKFFSNVVKIDSSNSCYHKNSAGVSIPGKGQGRVCLRRKKGDANPVEEFVRRFTGRWRGG
ncbi:MAG: hypothetical protein WBD97_26220, partial [Pseudolabrys sp.]